MDGHDQSWLRDGIFRNFLFWARSKNPENSKIPGIGIGILKPLKNPEKSRKQNPQKSRNLWDRDWDLKISKKYRKNPE